MSPAETRERLRRNPAVLQMAIDIDEASAREILTGGAPTVKFMKAVNDDFYLYGGVDDGPRHFGAIAEAIILILRNTYAEETP